jgi:general stress protein CsbA
MSVGTVLTVHVIFDAKRQENHNLILAIVIDVETLLCKELVHWHYLQEKMKNSNLLFL